MLPLLKEGDFVFGFKYLITSPKNGDVVVFHHTDYGLCVKKVTFFNKIKHTLTLEGLNSEQSLSSGKIGEVELKDVKCKVIYTFKAES